MELVDLAIAARRSQPGLPHPPFQTWTLPDGTTATEFHRSGAGYLLRFPGLADFEVSADGAEVTCRPTPDTSEATYQHLYINQVLPLVLGRLGKMVFHASAVEADGGALAFVAESSRGKSTLAASFAAAGAAFVTDESLVLDEGTDGYQVPPGHPSVRLWGDSERELLGPDAEAAPPLPFTDKRRILAEPSLRFSSRPAPLRRMYFLGDGGATGIELERMSAAEVALELVKVSFLLNVDDRSRVSSHFDAVARLARWPIHYRLDYPRRFDLLGDVHRAVLQHARGGEAE